MRAKKKDWSDVPIKEIIRVDRCTRNLCGVDIHRQGTASLKSAESAKIDASLQRQIQMRCVLVTSEIFQGWWSWWPRFHLVRMFQKGGGAERCCKPGKRAEPIVVRDLLIPQSTYLLSEVTYLPPSILRFEGDPRVSLVLSIVNA